MPRASARLSPASSRSARLGLGSAMGRDDGRRLGSDPMATLAKPPTPLNVRGAPEPLRGGPLELLRFLRAHGMLNHRYARLIARWAWLKVRWGRRLQTDGLCFVGPGVKLEIGRDAVLRLGRWSWIGHGSKIRVHEGEAEIGAKTVLGQECTISSFQHVS